MFRCDVDVRLSGSQRQRLREIAPKARRIVGGRMQPDGRPMTVAELEDECVEVGDLPQRQVTDRELPEEALPRSRTRSAGLGRIHAMEKVGGYTDFMPCKNNGFSEMIVNDGD